MWWKYEIFLDENRTKRILTTYVSAQTVQVANQKIREELDKYDVLLYPSAASPHLRDSLPRAAAPRTFSESPDIVVIPDQLAQQADVNSNTRLH